METIINLNGLSIPNGILFCTKDNDTLFMTVENNIGDYCITNLDTGKSVPLRFCRR